MQKEVLSDNHFLFGVSLILLVSVIGAIGMWGYKKKRKVVDVQVSADSSSVNSVVEEIPEIIKENLSHVFVCWEAFRFSIAQEKI